MGRIFEKPQRILITILVGTLTVGLALAQQATVVGTLSGHTDPVYSIAWSPDGKTIATAGFDNTVRLWDAGTRKEIKKFDGHSKLVLTVAFSPDGKELLSGSLDNTAKIWDLPTSGPAKTFGGLSAAPLALAVKPDQKQFVAASGKGVKVHDLTSGAVVKELAGGAGEVSSVAWRGDGNQIASGDQAHTIRLWKGSFEPDGVIESPSPAVLGLAYLPNNQQLVSAGSDGLARLWQLPVAEPRKIDVKAPAAVFSLSQDGTKLATAGNDKILRIWNLADGKLVKEIPAPDQQIAAAALRADGSQAALALANKVVRICGVGDGKEV